MKFKTLILLTLSLNTAIASNIGSFGQLFPIQEPDMMELIKSRLNHMKEDGELDAIHKRAEENVRKHAVRPTPVIGISPAKVDRTWLYSPVFTATQDITDGRGNYIIHKGESVNPLNKIPFSETLFFIDGDNKRQITWVKKKIKMTINFKVILVNGNIPETSDALNEEVYFDQYGVMVTKLGIHHTPAEVYQEKDNLRIKEFAIQ